MFQGGYRTGDRSRLACLCVYLFPACVSWVSRCGYSEGPHGSFFLVPDFPCYFSFIFFFPPCSSFFSLIFLNILVVRSIYRFYFCFFWSSSCCLVFLFFFLHIPFFCVFGRFWVLFVAPLGTWRTARCGCSCGTPRGRSASGP